MHADAPLAIAVFARAPIAGQAKTRLIPRLGAEGAAQLQARLIEQALAKARALTDARVTQVTLWLAADTEDARAKHAVAHFAAQIQAQHAVAVAWQEGSHLGARMAHAFARTLAPQGVAARCIVIGTDCPALTPADLADAAAALLERDVVVQPAIDGGYVLIGLRAPAPRLFENIAWGTADVLRATRERIAALGLSYSELRALRDLDTPADYDAALAAGLLE